MKVLRLIIVLITFGKFFIDSQPIKAGELLKNLAITTTGDRWNYPWNVTPGKRPKASVFRSTDPDLGVKRYGVYFVNFDTSNDIPLNLAPEKYQINEATIRILTSDNFEVPYDPSFDNVETYLPEDDPLFIRDLDPGRPVELFGAGIRNGLTFSDWDESAPYSPEIGAESSLYPAIYSFENDNLIDVSLAVDYDNPINVNPFAVGKLEDTEPGNLIPADSWMEFKIDLSQQNNIDYIRSCLSSGYLSIAVTSLNGGGHGVRTFPEFHTRDSLLGEPPQLLLSVNILDEPSYDLELAITKIEPTDSGVKLTIRSDSTEGLQIIYSNDLEEWHSLNNIVLEPNSDGSYSWEDKHDLTSMRFYNLTKQ